MFKIGKVRVGDAGGAQDSYDLSLGCCIKFYRRAEGDRRMTSSASLNWIDGGGVAVGVGVGALVSVGVGVWIADAIGDGAPVGTGVAVGAGTAGLAGCVGSAVAVLIGVGVGVIVGVGSSLAVASAVTVGSLDSASAGVGEGGLGSPLQPARIHANTTANVP